LMAYFAVAAAKAENQAPTLSDGYGRFGPIPFDELRTWLRDILRESTSP